VKNIDVNDKMNDSSPMMADARVGCRQFTFRLRLSSIDGDDGEQNLAEERHRSGAVAKIDDDESRHSFPNFFRVGNDETHTLVFNRKICLIYIRISKRVVEQAVVFVFVVFICCCCCCCFVAFAHANGYVKDASLHRTSMDI
jgi:hypothetical protein